MSKKNQQKILLLERSFTKAKSPNDKVRYLNEIVSLIRFSDVKRGISLSNQAYALAREVGYHEGTADAAYNLSRFYSIYFGDRSTALDYANTALEEYRNTNNVFGEARTVILLGSLYLDGREYPMAEKYLRTGLNLALKAGLPVLEGAAYVEYGHYHKQLNEFDTAIEYFGKALALWKQDTNKEGEAIVHHNMGVVYDLCGDTAQAMEHFTTSLHLRQELEDTYGIASSLHNIANLFIKSGDFENALLNFNLSLTIKQEIGYRIGEADTLNNIGSIFGEMSNYEMAHKYHSMALDIYRELENTRKIAQGLNNISVDEMRLGNINAGLEVAIESYTLSKASDYVQGVISACLNIASFYRQLRQLTEAMTYAEEGLTLCIDHHRRSHLPSYYIEIASIYFEKGEYEESISHFNKAIELAMELESKQHLSKAFYLIAQAYEKSGEFSASLTSLKNHLQYKEQLTNEKSLNRSNLLLSKIEMDQVKAENSSILFKYEESERQQRLCSRELQLIGLHLIEKNQFLKQINNEIQQNLNQFSVCQSCKLRHLVPKIETNLEGNKQWLLFMEKFDRFHDEFIKRLSTEFPEMTQSELKVATLIRVHMENKDIANLLCSSVRTIEWHRRNIRKKLGIDKNENLAVFLSSW